MAKRKSKPTRVIKLSKQDKVERKGRDENGLELYEITFAVPRPIGIEKTPASREIKIPLKAFRN